MRGTVAKYALLDSGFWIGMFDPTDEHHDAARKLYADRLEPFHALAAWPCFYEFLRTRFVGRPATLEAIEAALRLPGVERIADEPYRDRALEICLDVEATRRRPLSLADHVLRAIAADVRNRVDVIVTVDGGAFYDVAARREIEVWNLHDFTTKSATRKKTRR
jgi:predicted nucleic acid-binding protein